MMSVRAAVSLPAFLLPCLIVLAACGGPQSPAPDGADVAGAEARLAPETACETVCERDLACLPGREEPMAECMEDCIPDLEALNALSAACRGRLVQVLECVEGLSCDEYQQHETGIEGPCVELVDEANEVCRRDLEELGM